MWNLAEKMKADLLVSERQKESFDGWIAVLIVDIVAIVIESMGASF